MRPPLRSTGGDRGVLLGAWIVGLSACLDAPTDFPEGPVAACLGMTACPEGMLPFVDDGKHSYSPGRLVVEGARCVCIDRFEASRSADGAAQSVPDALPWVELSFDEARSACQETGKRLCTGREWTAACAGIPALRYPYGDELLAGACNLSGRLGKTGSFGGCEGGWPGLLDMSGNASEWTGDVGSSDSCSALGCTARGGSFLGGELELACGFRVDLTTTSSSATIGFRCCRDPDPS